MGLHSFFFFGGTSWPRRLVGHALWGGHCSWEWGVLPLWLEPRVLCCVAICLRDHRGKCFYARSCGTQPTPAGYVHSGGCRSMSLILVLLGARSFHISSCL